MTEIPELENTTMFADIISFDCFIMDETMGALKKWFVVITLIE